MKRTPRTLLLSLTLPTLLLLILAVVLTLSLKNVQARRMFRGGNDTYYQIINSCTDGLELGLAIDQSADGTPPYPETEVITATGTLLLDNSTVLSTIFTLTKPGVELPGDPPPDAIVSVFSTAGWTKDLDPGSRVDLQMETSTGTNATVSFLVHDCVLTNHPPHAISAVFPDPERLVLQNPESFPPADPPGSPSCISSTMEVTKTAPIDDLNVAMYLYQGKSVADTTALSATLTSPAGTRVKLFEGIGGERIGIGSRCSDGFGVFPDPMADFVLADDSVFNFDTPGITAPYEKTAITPMEPLSAFRGEKMTGNWTLDICNLSPDPQDSFRCWYMEMWEAVAPAAVDIAGPTTGSTGVTYHFTATVDPVSTTVPLTYTWQATGQEPIINVAESLTDAATLSWNLAGTHVVTVTAENVGGVMTDTHLIAIARPPAAPTAVAVSGATTGLIDTAYEFGATVSPISTTLPLTYTWTAFGQEPIINVAERLTDTTTLSWTTAGTKLVTATAENTLGLVTGTHLVTITGMPVPPSAVDISGPTLGIRDAAIDFTATVSPSSTTQPLTYTWRASGQTPVVHKTASPIDVVTFGWNATGTKTITVTAENLSSVVTDTYAITIGHGVFLPAVLRRFPGP